MTSDLEGFGLVVIESMSYGVVPVVYGSYEAIYDIIDNGKSGLITPIPYNSQKTIDCISLLIENEELRKKWQRKPCTKRNVLQLILLLQGGTICLKKYYKLP